MKKIILHVLLMFFLALTACQQLDPTPENKLLLISFDGFRYDYLSKVETPNFDSLAAEGVKAEGLIPVFPTKTFPNHYTITTGLYPENSGLIGNTMYDPKWEEWYRIRDRKAVQNGKWYSGEPIWNTLEKQGLRTGTLFWVGSEADIQEMRPTFWKPFDGSMPEKARIDTVVKWLNYPGGRAVDFATLYFELVDTQGHRHGTDSDSLKNAIRKADRLIGYLKNRMQDAGLWDKTNILIVSDHGMTDLSADRIIRLDSIIDTSDVERVIWGPMTMIQPKDDALEKVYQSLKSKQKHYRVFKKEKLPGRFHLDHHRVTDIVMIADLGYTILDENYEPRFLVSLPQATHGYDNSQQAMHAFFLARGPAFREAATTRAFKNVHLYELMNHLMNTNPAPNDGSLDSVRVLLK